MSASWILSGVLAIGSSNTVWPSRTKATPPSPPSSPMASSGSSRLRADRSCSGSMQVRAGAPAVASMRSAIAEHLNGIKEALINPHRKGSLDQPTTQRQESEQTWRVRRAEAWSICSMYRETVTGPPCQHMHACALPHTIPACRSGGPACILVLRHVPCLCFDTYHTRMPFSCPCSRHSVHKMR